MVDLENQPASDSTRSRIFIVTGVITALLVAAFIYILVRSRPTETNRPQRLEGALQAGPEFEHLRSRIHIDQPPEGLESARPIGDIVMELTSTIRNFTGRTITGLEVRGAVVDPDGNTIRERIVSVVPKFQEVIEPNQTMKARVVLEGISKDAVRANIVMEVAGVKVK
jgi:hypothetical protein